MRNDAYDRIKARLLNEPLPEARPLEVSPLAAELGISTTPVREALTRLATERLVTFTPRKGFFTRTFTEEEIRGLYHVNQALLESVLKRHPHAARTQAKSSPAAHPVAQSLAQDATVEDLVRSTAALFLKLVESAAIAEAAYIIRNINDRLHHVRRIECDVIPDVPAEVTKIHKLVAFNRTRELRDSILCYHEKRQSMVPSILKELWFRRVSNERGMP